MPLIPDIESLLLETKKKQTENRRKCKNAYIKEYTDYICVDDLGVLLKPDFLSRHLQIILKKNNLKHIRYHDLRHSCASLFIANGVSLKEIQDWLGHSDYGTTLNIYAHAVQKSNTKALNLMANLLEETEQQRTQQRTKVHQGKKKTLQTALLSHL